MMTNLLRVCPSSEWETYAEDWHCRVVGWADLPFTGQLCGSVLHGHGNPDCVPNVNAAPFTWTGFVTTTPGRWVLERVPRA